MKVRLRALGIGIVSCCAIAGCGQSSTDATADAATARLQSDVAAVTSAAANGNTTGARAALTTLETDLTAARDAGALTPTHYAQINAAIASVTRDLTTTPTPSSTTSAPPATPAVTTAPIAPPAPASTRAPKKHGHDKGDGKG